MLFEIKNDILFNTEEIILNEYEVFKINTNININLNEYSSCFFKGKIHYPNIFVDSKHFAKDKNLLFNLTLINLSDKQCKIEKNTELGEFYYTFAKQDLLCLDFQIKKPIYETDDLKIYSKKDNIKKIETVKNSKKKITIITYK